jgi:protein Tex
MLTSGFDPSSRIAEELKLPVRAVRAVAQLLADGATVPFIARYRKEQTGGLDEVAIRAVDEKRAYLLELDARRQTILRAIEAQGKLTPELRRDLEGCVSRATLEDLYAPYKTKRRTRASIARERGLEPLAKRIMAQPSQGDPRTEARAFVSAERGVPDVDVALAGARDIVAEVVADRADVRALARARFDREGVVESVRVPAKTKVPTKFEAYYEFQERCRTIPSHRVLAILRGEEEGVLRVKVRVDEEALAFEAAKLVGWRRGTPFAVQLEAALVDSTKRLLGPSIESDVRADLKERADIEAVNVFAQNLAKLLLAPPFGRQVVVGIDPGQRTGCKCVVVDDTGKLLTHTALHLVQGEERDVLFHVLGAPTVRDVGRSGNARAD